MMFHLKDLAEVRAGHPFRGSVPVHNKGSALVIQMRDVAVEKRIAWSQLARTDLSSFKTPDWLHSGDLLFAARGGRNYALCLSEVPDHTVCAQYFFVLRCKPGAGVMPQYLAWHINREPSQRYLMSNAEGSAQLSIRRAVLEDMPIAVPDVARQRLLVDLALAASEERQRLEALIRNRERQIDTLAQHLFAPPPRTH